VLIITAFAAVIATTVWYFKPDFGNSVWACGPDVLGRDDHVAG
jgi:hypothetical protein